jgi:hypothetical protein
MKRLLTAVLLLLAMACPALADGKFYAPPETVPPDLPYQRAFIAHDGSRELLILQSKCRGDAKDFGWVVPVPSLPELASMSRDNCDWLFRKLDRATAPEVVHPHGWLISGIFILWVASLAYSVILALLQEFGIISYKFKPSVAHAGCAAVVLFVLMVYLVVTSIPMCGMTGGRDVEILSEARVGIYDVKVIRAEDTKPLVEWLQDKGYAFTGDDEAAFKEYVAKRWCFVTARVNTDEKEGALVEHEGLVMPLVMIFESEKPVYPLALTGTAGKETMILLYLLASHKLADPGKRFELDYAGRPDSAWYLEFDYLEFDPKEFKSKWKFDQKYLTKLKGTLTPWDMRSDLVLKRAPDDDNYREYIYQE